MDIVINGNIDYYSVTGRWKTINRKSNSRNKYYLHQTQFPETLVLDRLSFVEHKK